MGMTARTTPAMFGICSHIVRDDPEDGTACTVGDQCVSGGCVSGERSLVAQPASPVRPAALCATEPLPNDPYRCVRSNGGSMDRTNTRGDIVNVSLHIATDGCNTPTTDCGPAGHPVAEISVILSQDPTCWNCGHHRRTNPVDPCDNADCQIVSCTNTTGRTVIPQRLWDRVRQRQFPVHGLPGQRRRCPLRGEAVYDLRWFRGAQCLCHSDGPPCDHVPVPHRGCAARRLDAGFAAALRRGYNEDDGEEHPPPAGGVCDEKCDEHVGAARKNPLPFVYRRRRL